MERPHLLALEDDGGGRRVEAVVATQLDRRRVLDARRAVAPVSKGEFIRWKRIHPLPGVGVKDGSSCGFTVQNTVDTNTQLSLSFTTLSLDPIISEQSFVFIPTPMPEACKGAIETFYQIKGEN